MVEELAQKLYKAGKVKSRYSLNSALTALTYCYSVCVCKCLQVWTDLVMLLMTDLYKEYGLFQRLTKLEEEFKGANILMFKYQQIPAVCSLCCLHVCKYHLCVANIFTHHEVSLMCTLQCLHFRTYFLGILCVIYIHQKTNCMLSSFLTHHQKHINRWRVTVGKNPKIIINLFFW